MCGDVTRPNSTCVNAECRRFCDCAWIAAMWCGLGVLCIIPRYYLGKACFPPKTIARLQHQDNARGSTRDQGFICSHISIFPDAPTTSPVYNSATVTPSRTTCRSIIRRSTEASFHHASAHQNRCFHGLAALPQCGAGTPILALWRSICWRRLLCQGSRSLAPLPWTRSHPNKRGAGEKPTLSFPIRCQGDVRSRAILN